MNPYSVSRLCNFEYFFAESMIYLFVRLPIPVFPDDTRGKIVKKGPDYFVAESKVVIVDLLYYILSSEITFPIKRIITLHHGGIIIILSVTIE